MPVAKNKPTTLSPEGSTSESSSPVVPDQEEFRQHLRRLAVSAVQVLIEQVMREELEQALTLEPHGVNALPPVVAIAIGPTRAIW